MRLSEAIRLGAMMKPQAFGVPWQDSRTFWQWLRGKPPQRASCAIYAAIEAVGAPLIPCQRGEAGLPTRGKVGEATHTVELPSEWMPILGSMATCPHCGQIEEPVSAMIPHLNDDHRLSREAIADWVSTIEQQHEQPTAPPVEVACE